MERKKAVMVRLSETELAKLDVLCLGGSRDGYFRNVIEPMAEQRASILEAAINGFLQAASAPVADGYAVQAAEYQRLISKYEADLAILRRVGE